MWLIEWLVRLIDLCGRFTYLPIFLLTCLFTYFLVFCFLAYLLIFLLTYLPTSLLACLLPYFILGWFLFQMKAMHGVKMSYRLQELLQQSATAAAAAVANTASSSTCTLLRGVRLEENNYVSLNSYIYSLIRGNRGQRRALLTTALNMFDDTTVSWKQLTCCHALIIIYFGIYFSISSTYFMIYFIIYFSIYFVIYFNISPNILF